MNEFKIINFSFEILKNVDKNVLIFIKILNKIFMINEQKKIFFFIEQIKNFYDEKIEEISDIIFKNINFYKKYYRRKVFTSIYNRIKYKKGNLYTKKIIINNLFQLANYYYNLLPLNLKLNERISLENTIKNYYNFNSEINLSFENNLFDNNFFSTFLQKFYQTKKKKLFINFSGQVKYLITNQEIFIDFCEIIPYLNKKKFNKTKNKFIFISNFFIKLLIRQFPFINQINFYISIYYAKKDKNFIINENFYVNNIKFIFINL